MKLYCKRCNEILTTKSLIKAKGIKLEDESELLSADEYIEAFKTSFNFGVPIEYLVHSESILLNDHKDDNRFIGCCGPGQFEHLNKVCPNCKNEIGIYIADCCTPRFIGIDKNKVSLQPLW